jgi:replicative DNA helicase
MVAITKHPQPGLKGDTMLMDAETRWPIRLRNLVDRNDRGFTVLTMRDAGVIRPHRPADHVEHDEVQFYRLTTYGGRNLEASAAQPLLTQDGWKPLSMLTASDAVAVVVEYPQFFGRGDTDEELVKLLAYLTASGTTGDGMAPEFDDVLIRQDLAAAAAAKGDECMRLVDDAGTFYQRVRGAGGGRSRTLRFLDMVGCYGVCGADKRIPDFVFGLRRDKLRLYLNRLFTCDGTSESTAISYETPSVRFARQLQHLLARFGISCMLRGREREPGILGSVVLSIHRKQDALRFLDEIGFFGAKAIKAESTHTVLHHVRMLDPELDRLGPILFDKVIAIEETDRGPAYNLGIDGAQNYVASDFIVQGVLPTSTAVPVDAGWQLATGSGPVLHA